MNARKDSKESTANKPCVLLVIASMVEFANLLISSQRAFAKQDTLDHAAERNQSRQAIIAIQTRVLTVAPVFKSKVDMTAIVIFNSLEHIAKLTSVPSVMFTPFAFEVAVNVSPVTRGLVMNASKKPLEIAVR